MPRNKDLKRHVRARMTKTGEAYTAARAQLMAKPAPRKRAAETSSPSPNDYAALAGMSDAAVKERTGCTWERWVRSLDHHGAAELSHGKIAALVRDKYKMPSWWSQMVAVGYERIKGLRARGQQRDGTHQMTKSRTYGVPVATLFDAWADADIRRRWLNGAKVKVRTATKPKSLRLDWTDGSIIAVGFVAKGEGKSSVALEHTKLPDRETAERLKREWSERLDELGRVLSAS